MAACICSLQTIHWNLHAATEQVSTEAGWLMGANMCEQDDDLTMRSSWVQPLAQDTGMNADSRVGLSDAQQAPSAQW